MVLSPQYAILWVLHYTALKQDLLAREFAVVLSNIGKIGKLLSFKLTSYIIRVIYVYAKQKHPGYKKVWGQ